MSLPTKRHTGSFEELLSCWLFDEDKLNNKIEKGFCYGWTNECFSTNAELKKKGKTRRVGWIVFIDYDDLPRSVVEMDCKNLQKRYDLGDAILLRTRKGYHVYFLDVVHKEELENILYDSIGDKLFEEVGLIRSNTILTFRLGKRDANDVLDFSKVVKSDRVHCSRPISINHYYILKAKWPEIKIDLKRSKKKHNVMFVCYKVNN